MRAPWIRRGRRFRIGHVAAMLAFVLGCGDDTDLPTRYPVSGTVTYNGQKLERGQITFVAQAKENPRNASGSIQDGYYTLTTATPGDGALPGEYRVAVNAKQVDSALLEAAVRKHGARPTRVR